MHRIVDASDYIKTTTHSYVSRQAEIINPKQLDLKGRAVIEPSVVIASDKAFVKIGRYCYIGSDTKIRPPVQPGTADTKFVPVSIGSHTIIGRDCDIQAAAVGSQCWIEDGVRLGSRVIIKDCCVIGAGSDIADDTVVPPFTRVEKAPRPELQGCIPYTIELPPSTATALQEQSVETFETFVAGR